MIEGDVSEDVQADKDAKDSESNDAIKEGINEAEENANEKAQNEENVNKSSEETSKNNETDNEGSSKESNKTSKSSYGIGLDESYFAGIEKVLRNIPQEEIEIDESEQSEQEENELEQSSSNGNEKFKIAVLPNLTDSLESSGISINYGVFVNGYTKEMEASKDFARYLAYENAGNLYIEAGKLSSRNNLVYESENIANVLKQYEKSVCAPKIMENGDYWLKLEISFSNIWNGTAVEEIIKEMIQ